MSLDCDSCRLELAAARRGEVTEVSAVELEAHLAGCPECRRAEAEAGRLFALLDSYQPDAAPGGADRLRLAISTGRYRSGTTAAGRGRLVPLPAAVAAVAAAFLAALWIGSSVDWRAGGAPDPVPAGVLSSVEGASLVSGPGGAPAPGQVLSAGSRIRLDESGSARLVLSRGAHVDLAGGSVFEVRAGDSLFLEKGRLLAVVRKGGEPFSVSTPEAEVLTLGTRFLVESLDGRTRVSVAEGRVRFTHTGPGDGSVEVAGRQTSTVAAGSAPSAPAAASAEDLAWSVVTERRHLELEIAALRSGLRLGERVSARLRLTNRSRGAVSVDGAGRGRSSYFVRVEEASGRRSHFAPAVLVARIGGMRTESPVIRLEAGQTYEMDLDLGRLGDAPGEYRVTAIYVESAASAVTDWSGALESAPARIVLSAPPKAGPAGGGDERRDGKPRRSGTIPERDGSGR